MDVTISGRHVDVTDAMREHARVRAEKLDHFGHDVKHITVTLSIQGERHAAEFVVAVRGRRELVAKAESHDMYVSIDEAAAKMEKQIQKLEDRLKDRREAARKKWAGGEGTTAT